MTSENCCKINWSYLPIKAHYFFMFGALGGTVPYMQVIAKEFGISSVAIGIIFSAATLCIWISKPAFGFITDKFRNISMVIMILLIATALAFFAVLYIPPIRNEEDKSVAITVVCKEIKDELVIYLPKYHNMSSCDEETMKRDLDCQLTSHECLKNISLSGSFNMTNILPNNYTAITGFPFKLKINISNQDCDCLEQNFSKLVCGPDFYACSTFNTKVSEYETYNFWIFVLLTVISGTGAATMWSLSDAVCNEILGDNSRLYGKQRLWGTISWGITTFASGFFNDLATGDSKNINYSPGFYLMLAFFAIDMLILCQFRVQKAHVSMNICKDVKKIFSSLKTVIFAVGVYICGALSGLLWTYQFWFLTELGSKALLLGLVVGVQCLIAEVPFFFFSGWFIKKIGHFYCLISALLAFAIRMGLYSVLHDVWWVLPIELLHGVTYAVFYAAMTMYSTDYAPPGTEATMLGIFGGLFEGLGYATGSFLGGFGFDSKGGRWTFFIGSMISLSSAFILTLCNAFLSRSKGILKLSKHKTISMKEIATSQDQIR